MPEIHQPGPERHHADLPFALLQPVVGAAVHLHHLPKVRLPFTPQADSAQAEGLPEAADDNVSEKTLQRLLA